MRYAWDQEHAYFPRRRGLVARLRRQILTALRTWDVASAARVDAFAANSSFVARRIERYYRRDAEVVPPPVDVDFFTPGSDDGVGAGDGPYCLTVAAPAPYKRLEVALAACEAAGVELRLVGDGPGRSDLERRAGPRARFLGRVDGDELRALYRGALCLLQPGVEDFGIAPVEALACGTPVVALGRGGVLDIVTDGEHGLLYPGVGDGGPDEVDALAATIDKCRRIDFNGLNLRSRAETFSRTRFVERFRRFVGSHLAQRQRPTTPGASSP
jgi:glycosyltransferase involved in cell wall biosynthesis